MHCSRSVVWWAGAVVLIAIVLALPFIVIDRVMPGWYPVKPIPLARFETFAEGVIRYEDSGSGDTAVLLLHAFNAELGQWEEVWQALAGQQGQRLLRIDIPGFGASEWQAGDFGLPQQGARVMELVDRLKLRKVRIVGTSMGASLAASIAADYPDRVEAVILMAPSGWPNSLNYPGLYGRLVRPGSLNAFASWIARSRVYGRIYPRSRAVQTLTVTASYGDQWAESLARISAPTLIVWSRGDRTASYQLGAAPVHKAIRDSALVSLDESARHSIPDNRPALTAAMIGLLAQGIGPKEIPGHVPDELWLTGERP